MVRDSKTILMGRRHYVVVVELTFLGFATTLYFRISSGALYYYLLYSRTRYRQSAVPGVRTKQNRSVIERCAVSEATVDDERRYLCAGYHLWGAGFTVARADVVPHVLRTVKVPQTATQAQFFGDSRGRGIPTLEIPIVDNIW